MSTHITIYYHPPVTFNKNPVHYNGDHLSRIKDQAEKQHYPLTQEVSIHFFLVTL